MGTVFFRLSFISSILLTNQFPNFSTVTLLLSRFSRVRLCATPWTAAHQAPPSLGFSRLEWAAISFSRESTISTQRS